MSHFNADIRIIKRVVSETFKGIQRTRWMNLIIITTMAAILSIFGCLFRTSLAISDFVEHLGDSLEVSVYLKQGYNTETAKTEIFKIGNIKEIKVIPREQAWEKLKQEMDVPDIKNPLPDTLRLKVKNQAEIEYVVTKVKNMPFVESIQYARDIVEKIIKVGDMTSLATFVVLLVLGGLTLSIINNTIHLVIQSRSEEIEIMRMMGVGNWYIRAPYILQGSFYGFCGAIISIIPLRILENYILSMIQFFNMGEPPIFTNLVVVVLMTMGIFVGSLGSFISVRKYLRI
ncbi:MAG: permease-like cell division protein FtsX [bacterium]